MQGSNASKTAAMIAGYRARASAASSPIITDPWAAALAGEDGMAYTRALDRSQPHTEAWIATRTRWLDDRVRYLTSAAHRIPQVVMLGAGFDTRAARLAREGLRFFEVDHPASQADKRERVAALDAYPVDAITFVDCDFETQDFLERLTQSGFQTDVPAVIVWEGVIYYLTEEAVRATLRRIATSTHPSSPLLFDYLGKKMVEGAAKHEADRETGDELASFGEPLKFGINDPLPLLFEEGYRQVEVVTFDEAALNITGTYERERRWRFQGLVQASVRAVERRSE